MQCFVLIVLLTACVSQSLRINGVVDTLDSWKHIAQFIFRKPSSSSGTGSPPPPNGPRPTAASTGGLLSYEIELSPNIAAKMTNLSLLVYTSSAGFVKSYGTDVSCAQKIASADVQIPVLHFARTASYENSFDPSRLVVQGKIFPSTTTSLFQQDKELDWTYFALANCNSSATFDSVYSQGPISVKMNLEFSNGDTFSEKHYSMEERGIVWVFLAFMLGQSVLAAVVFLRNGGFCMSSFLHFSLLASVLCFWSSLIISFASWFKLGLNGTLLYSMLLFASCFSAFSEAFLLFLVLLVSSDVNISYREKIDSRLLVSFSYSTLYCMVYIFTAVYFYFAPPSPAATFSSSSLDWSDVTPRTAFLRTAPGLVVLALRCVVAPLWMWTQQFLYNSSASLSTDSIAAGEVNTETHGEKLPERIWFRRLAVVWVELPMVLTFAMLPLEAVMRPIAISIWSNLVMMLGQVGVFTYFAYFPPAIIVKWSNKSRATTYIEDDNNTRQDSGERGAITMNSNTFNGKNRGGSADSADLFLLDNSNNSNNGKSSVNGTYSVAPMSSLQHESYEAFTNQSSPQLQLPPRWSPASLVPPPVGLEDVYTSIRSTSSFLHQALDELPTLSLKFSRALEAWDSLEGNSCNTASLLESHARVRTEKARALSGSKANSSAADDGEVVFGTEDHHPRPGPQDANEAVMRALNQSPPVVLPALLKASWESVARPISAKNSPMASGGKQREKSKI